MAIGSLAAAQTSAGVPRQILARRVGAMRHAAPVRDKGRTRSRPERQPHDRRSAAMASAPTDPPPLTRLLAEATALLPSPLWARACRRIAGFHHGDGRRVIVIPGFLAGDLLTRRLRRTLKQAGYRPEGWGQGIDWGVRRELFDRLVARIDGGTAPVVLLGWSLGGLYAREAAKLRVDRVDRVITLGSPFSGDPHANNAWKAYEAINRHPVDDPPLDVDLPAKPPVPTFALWSPIDGIVAPAAARGLPGESDRRIAVPCRHIDFCYSPLAIAAVLDAISERMAPPPPPTP